MKAAVVTGLVIDAIRKMQSVCRLPGGCFTIAFHKYNRTKGEASPRLEVREGCTTRPQLPQDVFQISSDNFFLFQDKEGDPKTCWRVLLRFVGFPPEFKLQKVNWFRDE